MTQWDQDVAEMLAAFAGSQSASCRGAQAKKCLRDVEFLLAEPPIRGWIDCLWEDEDAAATCSFSPLRIVHRGESARSPQSNGRLGACPGGSCSSSGTRALADHGDGPATWATGAILRSDGDQARPMWRRWPRSPTPSTALHRETLPGVAASAERLRSRRAAVPMCPCPDRRPSATPCRSRFFNPSLTKAPRERLRPAGLLHSGTQSAIRFGHRTRCRGPLKDIPLRSSNRGRAGSCSSCAEPRPACGDSGRAGRSRLTKEPPCPSSAQPPEPGARRNGRRERYEVASCGSDAASRSGSSARRSMRRRGDGATRHVDCRVCRPVGRLAGRAVVGLGRGVDVQVTAIFPLGIIAEPFVVHVAADLFGDLGHPSQRNSAVILVENAEVVAPRPPPNR